MVGRPLSDHAVVRVEHTETVGKSGLVWATKRRYIGDKDSGGYSILRAVVESVGPGRKITKGVRWGDRAPVDLNPGDVVWIGRFAGLDLDDTEDVRLIRQNEALFVEEAS